METAMRPFELQRIDHVVLRVSDPERSLAFYRDVLGCEVARRRDDLGLIHLHCGASMIDLVDVHGKLGLAGGAAAGPGSPGIAASAAVSVSSSRVAARAITRLLPGG